MKTIIIFFMLCGLCYAEPTIDNVLSNTLHGSSFGPKSQAAPKVWNNFSDGQIPTDLSINGNMVVSTTNARGVSAYTYEGNIGQNPDTFFTYNKSGTKTKWFVQYWMYISAAWEWSATPSTPLSNIKFFRLFDQQAGQWDGTGNVYPNFAIAYHTYSGVNKTYYAVENNGTIIPYVTFNPLNITKSTWHCQQFQYGENSASDAEDGVFKYWYDGAEIISNTALKTRYSTYTALKRPYIVGLYDSVSGLGEDVYVYYTDVYIDDTWARVEIGNNQDYTSCTHREIQIPSSWSDTSITITVNQGSFNDGDLVHVFVINAAGEASAGFPVIISGGQLSPPSIQVRNITYNNITFGD